MLYIIRFYEPGSLAGFAKHEDILEENIKAEIGPCKIRKERGRFFLEAENSKADEILKGIQGISSFSRASLSKIDDLSENVLKFSRELLKGKKTFALRVKRTGEHVESSHEVAAYLGERILKSFPGLKVDLDNPEAEIFVEIREEDCYIFSEIIRVEKREIKVGGEKLKFIADDMVGKLSKRLRILGYDATYISGAPDYEYFRRARSESRILLTRDRFLSEESGIQTLLIKSTDIEEQLKQVVKELKLKVDKEKLFGRCSVCNVLIEPEEKEKVKSKVPERVYKEYSEFHRCPKCGRIYWKGSHYDKLMKEFEKL